MQHIVIIRLAEFNEFITPLIGDSFEVLTKSISMIHGVCMQTLMPQNDGTMSPLATAWLVSYETYKHWISNAVNEYDFADHAPQAWNIPPLGRLPDEFAENCWEWRSLTLLNEETEGCADDDLQANTGSQNLQHAQRQSERPKAPTCLRRTSRREKKQQLKADDRQWRRAW